jgi:hypothetical protein
MGSIISQLSKLFVNPDKQIIADIENKIPFTGPTEDNIVNSIITQFINRSAMGYQKYGTTLDRTDLKLLDWIQHAQEEMMDGILYLEKMKNIVNNNNKNTLPFYIHSMER